MTILLLTSCARPAAIVSAPVAAECTGSASGEWFEALGCGPDDDLVRVLAELPGLPSDARVDMALKMAGRDESIRFFRILTAVTGSQRAGVIDAMLAGGDRVHRDDAYVEPPGWPLDPGSPTHTELDAQPRAWWRPGPGPSIWRQSPDPFASCPDVNYAAGGILIVDSGAAGIFVHDWYAQGYFPAGGCGG